MAWQPVSAGFRVGGERTAERGQPTPVLITSKRPHPLPPSAALKGLANRHRDTRRIEREILRSRRLRISVCAPVQAPAINSNSSYQNFQLGGC